MRRKHNLNYRLRSIEEIKSNYKNTDLLPIQDIHRANYKRKKNFNTLIMYYESKI